MATVSTVSRQTGGNCFVFFSFAPEFVFFRFCFFRQKMKHVVYCIERAVGGPTLSFQLVTTRRGTTVSFVRQCAVSCVRDFCVLVFDRHVRGSKCVCVLFY